MIIQDSLIISNFKKIMNTEKQIRNLKKIGLSYSTIEKNTGIGKNYLSFRIKHSKPFKSKIRKKIVNYYKFLIKQLENGLND